MLKSWLNYLILTLICTHLGSCFKSDQYRIPLSEKPKEKELLTCDHKDAIAVGDNQCHFYACNVSTDANYPIYQSYLNFIKDLDDDKKFIYQLFHKASKCKIDKLDHGCTMKGADNYNPYALVDDCSCEFSFCPKINFTHTSVQASYLKYKYHSRCEKVSEPTNTCKVADDCLCNTQKTAKTLNRYDFEKILIIKDKATLNELEKYDAQGFAVTVGKLINFLKPANVSFHDTIQSYIDGYLLDDPEGSEINELIPRHFTSETLKTMWEKSNNQYLVNGAPYSLHAVVYRPDLVKFDKDGKILNAGQGRLIFSLNPSGDLKQFKEPSHIIMEYWLPLDELSQAEWNLNFAKLKCLEGQAYINQLKLLIKKFAYTSTENFDAIRVNDFRGRDHDKEEEWALFEFRFSSLGLVRVPLPLTPKDNGAESSTLRGQGQNFSAALHDQIGDHFIQEFQKIKNPSQSYSIPLNLMAMQNTFEDLAAWGQDLQNLIKKDSHFMESTIPAERTYALYRYGLNTCVGCHSGAFIYHNPARVGQAYQPLVSSKEVRDLYGELRFDKITRNNFGVLHLFNDGLMSDYLIEDLRYRAQDVETLLTQTYCK
jgi:hypothetical protein